MDLAKLVVRLEAQSAQFLAELEKSNRKLDRFASQTSKTLNKWAGNLAGAFSIKAIVDFGLATIKAQDNLNDLAERTGESVETLSRLGYAASQSGSSVEGLSDGLDKLAKTAAAAKKGSDAAVAGFDAIDVSATNADGSLKDTETLLLEIAEQFSQYEDGLGKVALAQTLFGKSGAQLIPFLNKGAKGIQELTKRADELGITFSSKGAKAADAFGDAVSTLGQVTSGIFGRALEQVLPALNTLLEGFIDGEQRSEDFDNAVRVLATGLKLVLSAGVVVGEVFSQVGKSIGATVAALNLISEGEFGAVKDLIIDANRQSVADVQKTVDKLQAIWSEGGDAIVDDLAEVEVTVRKILGGGAGDEELEKLGQKLADRGKALTESLRTPLEVMQASIAEADALFKANIITLETWKRAVIAAAEELDPMLAGIARMSEGVKNFDDDIREDLEKFRTENEKAIQESAEKSFEGTTDRYREEMEAAQKAADTIRDQAIRNTQDILADGIETALTDGFDKGAEGILDGLGKLLTKMAAQALAAQIGAKLFGTTTGSGGGGGDGGGLIGKGIDLLAGWFAGTRDNGGRVNKGDAVLIGRGAQPEMFVADQPGMMYPAGSYGGAGGVTQNIYTSSPITQRTARQLEMEAGRRQRQAMARIG